MKRRGFITLLGGAAVAWPLAARAQRPAKLPIIGYLGSSTASAQNQWVTAFVKRLHELGWVEGRTMGGGTQGALSRDCSRVRSAQSRCHCYSRDCASAGSQGSRSERLDRLLPCLLA